MPVLACVVNVSEGRDTEVIGALAASAGASLLDLHSDAHHHRSVLTLAGGSLAGDLRRLAVAAIERIDLSRHRGVHPRLGVLDVVPFVPLPDAATTPLDEALAARDAFAMWAARELGLPCFVFGPERSLPELRREAFRTLAPLTGPDRPAPNSGAVAVGARHALVAYNLWLADGSVKVARVIAAALRSPAVRALGFDVGGAAQVSCNLVDPYSAGPADVYDAVAARAPVARAELVGLLPEAVLRAVPERRWAGLDLALDRTIEARVAAAGS